MKSKFVPQATLNRVKASIGYLNPRSFELFAIYRLAGNQFDDALTLNPLGSFSVFDLYFSRSIHRSALFYTSVENILNRQFLVAATPVDSNVAPFMLQIGFKMTF